MAVLSGIGYVPTDRAGRKKPVKFVGRTTRMGVEQYQDYTLYLNDDRDGIAGRHLTDTELCADWQQEFPGAVSFTPFHVRGVRRDFQKGTAQRESGSAHGVRGTSGDVIGGAPSRVRRLDTLATEATEHHGFGGLRQLAFASHKVRPASMLFKWCFQGSKIDAEARRRD